MGVQKTYTNGIKKDLGYSATWLPNVPLALGDVGTLKGYEFSHKLTLSSLGITFAQTQGTTSARLTHTSAGATRGVVQSATKSVGGPTATLSIRFAKAGGFMFEAAGCRSAIISNQIALTEAVIAHSDWQDDWCIVIEVVHAECSTILVAKEAHAEASLTAKVPITASMLLADASVGLELVSGSRLATHFIAESGLTPLFKCVRLKRGFLSAPLLVAAGTDQEQPVRESPAEPRLDELIEIDYSDFDGF